MKKVHRWLYVFSLFTWLANIALIIINLFVDALAIFLICLFASVIIQGILSGAFSSKEYTPEKPMRKTWLDYSILISKILSLLGTVVGAVSRLIAGGSPKVIDEKYCIVNHGDIVRVVSKNWFVYLSVCEYLTFFFCILIFTTFMFARIRFMYLMQASNK